MLPPPDTSFRVNRASGGISVQQQLPQQRPNPLLNLNPTDALSQPDQYTSSPQVDSSGIRHFANGRHFDLSNSSIQDAVAQTNASTLGRSNKQQLDVAQQKARDERRQARLQARAMRQNGGFPGGGFPGGGFPGGGLPGGGFPGGGSQNGGYQNGGAPAGYPSSGFQNGGAGGSFNNGYPNGGYQNNGYQNSSYQNNSYQNGYRNGGGYGYNNPNGYQQNQGFMRPYGRFQRRNNSFNDMDRYQRRAMRRGAQPTPELLIQNYNF